MALEPTKPNYSFGFFGFRVLSNQPTTNLDYCWRVELAGIARISRISGENHVLLYKKYRPLGMAKLSWKSGVKEWLVLFKRFPQVRLKEGRARWVRHFNWRLGRLKGCMKHRVLAL